SGVQRKRGRSQFGGTMESSWGSSTQPPGAVPSSASSNTEIREASTPTRIGSSGKCRHSDSQERVSFVGDSLPPPSPPNSEPPTPWVPPGGKAAASPGGSVVSVQPASS